MTECPDRTGVVGAGVMGRDLAGLLAAAGSSVTLVDVDEAALDAASEDLATRVPDELAAAGYDVPMPLTDAVTTASEYDALADAAFVVEAVPDRLGIKQDVVTALEAVLAPDAVIATNTSSLTAREVGAEATHPERVVLFHFANPAIDRDLLEIAGERASADALATARAVGEAIDKPPIELDRERRGNGLSRLSAAIKCSASWELSDQDAAAIESAARSLGFAVGPFSLIDRIGVDVHLATVDNLAVDHGDRFEPPAAIRDRLEAMVADGRLGSKTGAGFFEWTDGEPVVPEGDATGDVEPILAALVAEAHRIVADGVADRDRVDAMLRRGSGGAVGPFDVEGMLGADRVRAVLESRYTETNAPIFDPSVLDGE